MDSGGKQEVSNAPASKAFAGNPAKGWLAARILEKYPAFESRDYRLYWTASFVSGLGSQMTHVANGWQIYQLTRDAFMLGLTGLFSILPLIVFSLAGGVLADAVDRRKLLLFCQSILLLSSLALAIMTAFDWINVWAIYIILSINGAVLALNQPSNSALVVNLVKKDHLSNAISLGITNWQVTMIVGPSVGGLILGTCKKWDLGNGVIWIYVLDVVSFLFVLLALLEMKTRVNRGGVQKISISSALEGIRYVFGSPLIRSTMLMDFFMNLLCSFMVLMPLFAEEVFHVGPEGYGLLMAAPSIGSVSTAVFLSSAHQSLKRHGTMFLVSLGAYGLAWMIFGLSHTFWIAVLALVGVGAADTVNMIVRQSINQHTTPDHIRGRMVSVNMIFIKGGPSLGQFQGGAIARCLGAPAAIILGGVSVVLMSSVLFFKLRNLRNLEL